MKYIIPVCLVLMLGTQIFDYFTNGEFNIIFIAIACFLTPSGIKGINPEYGNSEQFKSLSKALLVIGVIIMSISLYISM